MFTLLIYIITLKDKDEETVNCGNFKCNNGKLFHSSCVELEEMPEDDWTCSPECQQHFQDDPYPFCICRKQRGGTMIQCVNKNCTGQWFHLSCLGLKSKRFPGKNINFPKNVIQK